MDAIINSGIRGLVYTSLALNTEVIFTAIRGWPRLEGHTQLWVIPLYFEGSLCLFEPLYRRIYNKNILVRMLTYAVTFLSIEYVAGLLLKRIIGVCPWEYNSHSLSVHGCINLAYAPLWGCLGLVAELLYKYLDRILPIK